MVFQIRTLTFSIFIGRHMMFVFCKSRSIYRLPVKRYLRTLLQLVCSFCFKYYSYLFIMLVSFFQLPVSVSEKRETIDVPEAMAANGAHVQVMTRPVKTSGHLLSINYNDEVRILRYI